MTNFGIVLPELLKLLGQKDPSKFQPNKLSEGLRATFIGPADDNILRLIELETDLRDACKKLCRALDWVDPLECEDLHAILMKYRLMRDMVETWLILETNLCYPELRGRHYIVLNEKKEIGWTVESSEISGRRRRFFRYLLDVIRGRRGQRES